METYADYLEWKDWRAESFGTCTRDQALYFRKILKKTGTPPGANVCELGFGNGALLGYLRDHGYNPTGTEIQEHLLKRAQDLKFRVGSSVDELGLNQPQDLIVMLDVLEHVEQKEIVPFLKNLATHIAAGGKLALTFPNGDSPFGLAYQNGDVTHVTAIGSGKLHYFAHMAGFHVEYCGAELTPLFSGGVSKILKRLIGLPLRTLLIIVLRNLFQINISSRFFSPNMMAVLRKPLAAPVP
jgi:hypothetical protein